MTTSYSTAVRCLSLREHSRLELKKKLSQKKFSAEEIEETLTQLIKYDLQSDERFSESYVRYRRQAGFGPIRIAMELAERGVAESLIDAFVDAQSVDWQKHMIAVFQKKFSAKSKDTQGLAKQFRFLSHRGFSAEMINHYLLL